jgi:ABC-2 type transport system permease protein
MLSKIWAMGLVVLVSSFLSLKIVVQGLLHVPVAGSLPLFFFGAALVLFATTSLGIFMATLSRNAAVRHAGGARPAATADAIGW